MKHASQDLQDLVDGRKRFRTAKEKFLHRTLKKRAKRRIVGPFWGDEEEQCPISLKDLAVIHLAQDFDEVMDHAEVHEDLGEAVNKIPAASKSMYSLCDLRASLRLVGSFVDELVKGRSKTVMPSRWMSALSSSAGRTHEIYTCNLFCSICTVKSQ